MDETPDSHVWDPDSLQRGLICEIYLIFSSPEPLAHGELLWSLDVWCVSSTIALKDISS